MFVNSPRTRDQSRRQDLLCRRLRRADDEGSSRYACERLIWWVFISPPLMTLSIYQPAVTGNMFRSEVKRSVKTDRLNFNVTTKAEYSLLL